MIKTDVDCDGDFMNLSQKAPILVVSSDDVEHSRMLASRGVSKVASP